MESIAFSSGFLLVVASHLHDWLSLFLSRGLIRDNSLLCGFPNGSSLPLFKPSVVSPGFLPLHLLLCLNKPSSTSPAQVCHPCLMRLGGMKEQLTRQTWSVWGSRH